MTTLTLDRLSALLQGLAPRVSLSPAPKGLGLHILVNAALNDAALALSDMVLWVTPPLRGLSDVSPPIPEPGYRIWMSFEVVLDGPVAPIFLAEFLMPVQIDLASADASLAQIVKLIASEMTVSRCGQPLMMDRAGDILLIGMLRHLISQPERTTGLFTALADPRIAKSLVAMHANASKAWSLESLADLAGMSRTSFATRFKRLMQLSPGKYLENLRFVLAHRLVTQGVGLKKAAKATGYASSSTLSRAMSRNNRLQFKTE
jgi:AraC-like DNA-binding protein